MPPNAAEWHAVRQGLSSRPQLQGVLLDQFGVLHDGKVAYPGAVDAVRHMAAQGLKLFILSNSSRRKALPSPLLAPPPPPLSHSHSEQSLLSA